MKRIAKTLSKSLQLYLSSEVTKIKVCNHHYSPERTRTILIIWKHQKELRLLDQMKCILTAEFSIRVTQKFANGSNNQISKVRKEIKFTLGHNLLNRSNFLLKRVTNRHPRGWYHLQLTFNLLATVSHKGEL